MCILCYTNPIFIYIYFFFTNIFLNEQGIWFAALCNQSRQGVIPTSSTTTREITRPVVKRNRKKRRAMSVRNSFQGSDYPQQDSWISKRYHRIMKTFKSPLDPCPPNFSGYHTGGVTHHGLIISQGEKGPQKSREPRYALEIYKFIVRHLLFVQCFVLLRHRSAQLLFFLDLISLSSNLE